MFTHTNKTGRMALRPVLLFVCVCVLGGATAEVLAQASALEEIIVTARKREESLQDTPISVAAFSSEDIESRGMVDFSDLGEFTPNVVFDFTSAIAAGNSAAIVMIRGVGSADWALPVTRGLAFISTGFTSPAPSAKSWTRWMWSAWRYSAAPKAPCSDATP